MADFTGQNIQDTYQRVVQIDGGRLEDGLGNSLPISMSGNDVVIDGTLRAQSYIVTESITIQTTGSTLFGDDDVDNHRFLGSITASSNISASGYIVGSNVYVPTGGKIGLDGVGGNDFINITAGQIEIFRGGSQKLSIQSKDVVIHNSDLKVSGEITASGNISASGEFIGAHPILIGDTLIHGGDLTIGQSGAISSLGGHVKLRLNAPGTGYEDIILFDKGNNNKWIMGSKAGQNEFMIAKEATTLTGTDPVFSLGTSGDVTASGNISSSGDILASTYKSHGTNAIAFSSNNIKISETYPIILNHSSTTATNITASGNIEAGSYISASEFRTTGHITASGDISSSARITALVMDPGHTGGMITDDRVSIGGGGTNNYLFSRGINTLGSITASSAITASSLVTSGMISSSGTNIFKILIIRDYISVSGHTFLGAHNAEKFVYVNRYSDAEPYGRLQMGEDDLGQDVGFKINTRNAGTPQEAFTLGGTGHITASGDISSSANSTASFGRVDVAGDISASGDVYADAYYSEGQAVLNYNEGNDRIQVGNKPTLIQGNLTASNDISASGDIIATNISASGDIVINEGQKLILDGNDTAGLTPAGNTYIHNGGTSDEIEFYVGGTQKLEIKQDVLHFNNGRFKVTGNITASGEISASDKITATQFDSKTSGTGYKLSGAKALYTHDTSTVVGRTGRLTLTGSSARFGRTGDDMHVTASGNISASGYISASNFIYRILKRKRHWRS